jgi:hypothetical protein
MAPCDIPISRPNSAWLRFLALSHTLRVIDMQQIYLPGISRQPKKMPAWNVISIGRGGRCSS